MKTPFLAALLCLMVFTRSEAVDLSDGLLRAVPLPGGKAPSFKGQEADWDLSGAEPFWLSSQSARMMNASVALEYDEAALYLFVKLRLPGRKLVNENSPADPFWVGDMVEFRLCSDPALPHPLPVASDPSIADSKRICHLSLWKNTVDGKSYMNVAYGGMLKAGAVLNPPGARLVFTDVGDGSLLEARIPWAALNCPDGKNPFSPGGKMTALFGAHWKLNDRFTETVAVYDRNPGNFGFRQTGCWGQVLFSPAGRLAPRHASMEEALAKEEREAAAPPQGVPIEIPVAEAGKLSVAILGKNGEVLRELTGGQPVSPGKATVYWDGADQWGFPLDPGQYRWGAYLSGGLKARYVGSVGNSGMPPYPTPDDLGGWGGDHGVPTSDAADASGLYLGWICAEAQRQIVKIDYEGKTLWRRTPFVKGGFTPMYALASNGKYLYAAYDAAHPVLSRIDTERGFFVLFDNPASRGTFVPICTEPNTPVPAPEGSLPADDFKSKDGTQPECLGLAASKGEVFASVYSQNLIQVLDAESGKPVRRLDCPRPRGLALDAAGNLYAVSCGADQPSRVFRFERAAGPGRPVVVEGLSAPLGIAVGAGGEIAVSDGAASQQVKIFSPDGRFLRAYGAEGGRPWLGAYRPDAFLCPSALAADARGGLLVAESSIPKIFDRVEFATGKNLGRWFGAPAYGVADIPDSDDPLTAYYPFEPTGFARATVPAAGGNGYPTAYWDFSKVGAEPGGPGGRGSLGLPYVKTLANGMKYWIEDTGPHYVCLVQGDDLVPVGKINVYNPHAGHYVSNPEACYEIWSDRDGDHKIEPDEVSKLQGIGNRPVPVTDVGINSMWLDANGDAYFLTQENAIVRIPSDGFTPQGAIRWNPAKASYAVPSVVPSLLKRIPVGPRQGMAGVRADSKGNLYTCIEATVPSLTPELAAKIEAANPGLPRSFWWVYADAGLAKRMHEGLGHTSENNVIKFAKYDPSGKPLWVAGRKAVAAPAPGELYHFWTMSGMVGDDYLSGGSEWGQIYFYTSDGFYVDAIMNDPATLAAAGPYTFGGETFSGRIEAFPKLSKVYAYQAGGIYEVEGFDKDLKVRGEKRLFGTVALDKAYAR
ncbi:MAG TPA: hypothetical protein VIM58_07445, partial [Candidatus Methylacidiphilales bacterium]